MAKNIESVSNYCNRWCERCPFTDRCGLMDHAQKGIPILLDEVVLLPNAFPAMSGDFADFLKRLDDQLQQQGTCLEKIGYGVAHEHPQPLNTHSGKLEKLAMDIAVEGIGASRRKPAWLPELYERADFTDPGVQAGHELYWYLTMIGPKYQRCFHGDPYGEDERRRYGDYGRDAAFTARLVHIVLVRVICSATVLMETYGQRAYTDLIQPLTGVLKLLAGLREQHPEAHLFRRPGFDDPGERAVLDAFYNGKPPVDPFADGTWSQGGRAPK